MNYLVTVDGHNGSSVVTSRWASYGYYDTSGNYYEPKVVNPANFERHIFSSGTTGGASTVGFGEVVIANDGTLDALRSWGFAGRAINLFSTDGTNAPVQIWRGTVEQPTVSWNTLAFRVRDRLADLNKELQTNKYAGTTTDGTKVEAEGKADDLKDVLKPLVYGRVFNISPIFANVWKLIYQVNDGAVADIPAVYDKGVKLQQGANYATLALLYAATVAPGTYATCFAAGLFRLGSNPAGQVTCDVLEGATAADRTAAQVAKRILTKLGMTTSDYVTASFAALDAKNSAEVGLYMASGGNALEAIVAVLGSIGGFIIPDNSGSFSVGRFEAPGTSAGTIDLPLVNEMTFKATDDEDRGIPAYKVTVQYARNWTVQNGSALVEGGCVTQDRRAFLDKEFREAVQQNDALKTQHPLAAEKTINTLLAFEADARLEAIRLQNLYGVYRDYATISGPLALMNGVDLAETWTVQLPRFGMSNGKNMLVIGITIDFAQETVDLDVWG